MSTACNVKNRVAEKEPYPHLLFNPRTRCRGFIVALTGTHLLFCTLRKLCIYSELSELIRCLLLEILGIFTSSLVTQAQDVCMRCPLGLNQ